MIKDWFVNGRFQLINLLCAGAAALLLYFFPSSSGLPLLLFVIPWGLYFLFQRRLPFRHTMLDWFLLLFVLTAVVGVLTAYDTETALTYFWLILGAVLLFYAVTARPEASPQLLVGGVCGLAVIISGHFLLTHNWHETPASAATLSFLTAAWMNVRPAFTSLADPNAAEGIMVITFPIVLAQMVWAAKTKHKAWLAAAALAAVLVLIGLLFSTSRGAWVALLAGLSFWILWSSGVRFSQRVSKRSQIVVFSLLIVGGVVGFSLLSVSGVSTDITNRLTGVGETGSRLKVAQDTLDLIEDFLFTGGGLGAFSGLYSHYILVIPYHFLSHSHDLFLDIMLEQGIGGLLAFVGIVGMTVLCLFTPQSRQENASDRYHSSYLNGALAASLVAMIVHGLVDDPLYSSEGMVFLFLIPAMVVWQYKPEPQMGNWYRTKWTPGLLAASLFFVAMGVVFYKPVSAKWQANLGAVQMAKVELREWPTGQWDDGQNSAELAPAALMFQRAVAIDTENRTAHHRLGLIAMLQQDFDTAVTHLEAANELDPHHRGIIKALGYSFVWQGDLGKAFTFLDVIPESHREMEAYIHWWGVQQQPELASRAEQMAIVLQENGRSSP